jgi:hypothetical protein
VQLSLQVLYMP